MRNRSNNPSRTGQSASAAIEPIERRTMLSAALAGPQFEVSSSVTFAHRAPVVAADADGDFVVVWKKYDIESPFGGAWHVYARRYSADGTPQGPQFQVSTREQGGIAEPAVAMADDGRFVIAWQATGIVARRYGADGSPRGGEIVVEPSDRASEPSVAMDADGDFVVAFAEATVMDGQWLYARRFSAAGDARGEKVVVAPPEFNVRTVTPSVAMDDAGDFAVAWEHRGAEERHHTVRFRQFDSTGAPRGETQLAHPGVQATVSYVQRPYVAVDDDGDAVVTWFSYGPAGLRAYARLYTPDGQPKGSAFPAFDSRVVPDGVAMDADGDFVIVAACQDPAGYPYKDELEVCARRFDASGAPREVPFRVNRLTESSQREAAVAMDDDGDFVVAWEHRFGTSVAGQRFDGDAPVPAAEVTGHHVFYGDSRFNQFGMPEDYNVDSRIDPNKRALRPGEAATYANVTNYDGGLTGVVVDIANLPRDVGTALGLDDFDFGGATPPLAMVRRRGEGAAGSDRVTFFWNRNNPFDPRANMAVANGWLHVTARANARTALSSPHAFSFGNLVGETGDGTGSSGWRVSALDLAAVRRALNTIVGIDSRTDFTRDRQVNSLDLAIVRRNLNRLLAPPADASRRVADEVLRG